MNENRYYKSTEVINMRFFKVPKTIIYNERYAELGSSEILAYSILSDRFELSIKNNWVDENDNIYMLFDRESLGKVLRVNRNTASEYIKELCKFGLMVDKRMGQGKPNRLYILKPFADDEYLYEAKREAQNVENTLMHENDASRCTKMMHLDARKSSTNDTELKDTNLSDTHSIIKEQKQEKHKQQKKKEQPKQKDDGLNELVNNLDLSSLETKDKAPVLQCIKVLYNTTKGITSNGILIKPKEIRENLKQLQYKHIEQGLKDYYEASNRSQITNPIAYLGSCIYNAMFKPEVKEITHRGYSKPIKTQFHNFEQRTSNYSREELERMVLKRK